MSLACVINRWYDGICASEEGGGGGVSPEPTDFHAEVFRRERRMPLEDLAKSGIDRAVQIEYGGVREYATFSNGDGTRRRRWLEFVVKVGYFVGDNVDEAHAVIASDDARLQNWLRHPSNYPTCQGTCVEDVLPVQSSVTTISDNRKVLRITLRVQIL
jgi:hypothetical protein